MGHLLTGEPVCFNSLQTGKYVASSSLRVTTLVNIVTTFQFPSNGKVCSKEIALIVVPIGYLSFNSLQTGKYVASGNQIKVKRDFRHNCFNSLQTGKYVASKTGQTRYGENYTMFQFPSNGKVCSKSPNSNIALKIRLWFQFPSNGKVCSKQLFQCCENVYCRCFNSLQTGKYVASMSH